jgi:hypothetical protein
MGLLVCALEPGLEREKPCSSGFFDTKIMFLSKNNFIEL